jgi:hypothetical protein
VIGTIVHSHTRSCRTMLRKQCHVPRYIGFLISWLCKRTWFSMYMSVDRNMRLTVPWLYQLKNRYEIWYPWTAWWLTWMTSHHSSNAYIQFENVQCDMKVFECYHSSPVSLMDDTSQSAGDESSLSWTELDRIMGAVCVNMTVTRAHPCMYVCKEVGLSCNL